LINSLENPGVDEKTLKLPPPLKGIERGKDILSGDNILSVGSGVVQLCVMHIFYK
jgi:hypothetical protein